MGLDHLATRILMGDREHAILEILTLTPHYFWGAYNISDQNNMTETKLAHFNVSCTGTEKGARLMKFIMTHAN